MVFSAVITFSDGFPSGFERIVVAACCFFSALIAGFGATGYIRSKGFFCGLAAGLLYFCLLWLSGVIFSAGKADGASFLMLLCCLVGGGVGGILRMNTGFRKKR
jgi:putative membrane protein (TIGR04086 family)